MKRIYSKTAFSILELMVASVLVVVICLGLFGINNVLNNNNQDYGQRYLVRSETQAALNHILSNASLAIGSGVTDPNTGLPDVGFQFGAGMPVKFGAFMAAESFCIHQDILPTLNVNSTAVNNPPTSLANYSTSTRWLCYTWYPQYTGFDYQIQYCAMPFNYANGIRGIYGCNMAASAGVTLAPPGVPVYLATTASDFEIDQPTLTNSGGQLLFSITLQSCLNNASPSSFPVGTCNAAGSGVSSDPVNNPEVQLTGSVFPAQEGAVQN